MPQFIEIFQPKNQAEFAIVQSFLRAEGVDCIEKRPRHENGQKPRPEKGLPAPLWAPADQAEQAREIIAAYLEKASLSEEDWAVKPPKGSGSFLQKIRSLLIRILSGP
ncbi:hypothetical protein [Desulfatibacillum aliphaticivorans]|uniref:hypothetical protein n=1 Tax=Desulfatibacillum aliphaticivorans TaxID=218208 RepID=UPI0004102EEF|nr:hypothetical protein [Desulfatibacillum aliphaticivorans]